MAGTREYDIVLWGATGYTGKYTAEHITLHLPTNISWAVAGRSQSKLQAQVEELKRLNSNRSPPKIEIAQLQKEDLHRLARKTKLIVNTVGPYMLYGEPVIEACASEGTHYLDVGMRLDIYLNFADQTKVTGETPWTRDMMKKYDALAKKTGAIIIPQTGIESAPADLMAYVLAKHVRTATSYGTREVVHSGYSARGSVSGGTIVSLLNLFATYSLGDIQKGFEPNAMLHGPLPKQTYHPTLFSRLLGARTVSDLGVLTTSPPGAADVPIVYRSWELYKGTSESYGDSFSFRPYLAVRNTFIAALIHVAAAFVPLFLALAPFRWMVATLGPKPGSGADREVAAREHIELRSMAFPDGPSKDKAFGRMRFEGSMYHLTGILLGEAAGTLVSSAQVPARALGGGVFTPATLGQAYVDRLGKVGVVFEHKTLSF